MVGDCVLLDAVSTVMVMVIVMVMLVEEGVIAVVNFGLKRFSVCVCVV